MKKQPGYPLPSGELGSDDIVCQLVYLPDRPEYWQAFYAALHYMTTWRAWERDDDKRGQDAAANWRAAFEMTSGCWRMTCLEQLQDDVAQILELLKIAPECCGETDITDGDRYTDRVEDGEGDVPQNIIDAGYAEDASDWDGFDDYKCMIAHVTVDQIEARLRELAPRVSQYGLIIGGVTTIAMVLATLVTAGGAAIFYGFIASTGAVALLYQLLTEVGLIEGLADDVATNHDKLACSIYWADGDEGAMVALNDRIDELFNQAEALILKNMNLGPTLKGLYAGRYDQQDTAEMLFDAGYELGDFDCACEEQIGEFTYLEEFETDYGILTNQGSAWTRSPGTGNPGYCYYKNGGSGWFSVWTTGSQLSQWAGGGPLQSIKIKKMSVDHRLVSGAGLIQFKFHHTGVGSPAYEQHGWVGGGGWNVVLSNFVALGVDEITAHDDQVLVEVYFNGSGQVNMDNVYIEFDLVP